MRILLFIIMLSHGLLHLIGASKSLKISTGINMMTTGYEKLWAVTALLFLVTASMFIVQIKWWWALALVSVILSQTLIIQHWQDAKFGTILNVVILMAAAIGFGIWNFKLF